MQTIEVWVALGEDGNHEVATDEQTALDRLVDASDEDLSGTACRLVRLNVTMADPHAADDDDQTDKIVDVAVPDDAGRVVDVEVEVESE